jgi:hypothetical protein
MCGGGWGGEEEIVPGAEGRFGGRVDVWADARTYLSGKCKCRGKRNSRFAEGKTERKASASVGEEADPCGMTTRKAKAKAKAKARARAKKNTGVLRFARGGRGFMRR